MTSFERAGSVGRALAAALAAWATGCAGASAGPRASAIGPDGGERHVIYAQGRETPITIKVDPVTTGSEHFVMGTAEIAQGSRVPVHRHDQDELIVVARGRPSITLGEQTLGAEPGTTVFIPAGTWIGLENHEAEPVRFIWVFTHLEFEKWVRAIAAREGEPPVQRPAAEVKEINRRYHMEFRDVP